MQLFNKEIIIKDLFYKYKNSILLTKKYKPCNKERREHRIMGITGSGKTTL